MENKNLQEEIIRLQDVVLKEVLHQTNMITGGNSYPAVVIMADHKNPKIYNLSTLMVAGQYPLYNLSVRATYKEASVLNFTVPEVRQMMPYALQLFVRSEHTFLNIPTHKMA